MQVQRSFAHRCLLLAAVVWTPIAAFAQNGQATVDCTEPGWNWVDVGIALTSNQPTYWSAYSGEPGGVSPFTILDPGVLPGRPAFDGTGDRVLRGFIVAWAVNANGEEIRWNHLKGDAVIVNYPLGAAWEYTAYAFQSVNTAIPNGQPTGIPGQIFFNGTEFDNGYDLLLLDFYAYGSQPFGINSTFTLNSALTLMPLRLDLRQETTGPTTTKASFTIWNQNEVKLTGLDRCVTCWDDTLFSLYDEPNHFLIENLQTDKGKAQIDGVASQLCNLDYDPGDACTQTFGGPAPACDPRDRVSEAASLLGVVVKQLNFQPPNGPVDFAGMPLVGMGVQSGSLLVDFAGSPPPERPTTGDSLNAAPIDGRPLRPELSTGSSSAQPVALAASDRGSASDKGSLIIYPKVELRWDSTGNVLIQDTFIDLTNDYPDNVLVQMYFVNGDAPFTPSEIDANTNGVRDDCEDRVNWSCNVTNGTANGRVDGGCHVNPAGPFTSLEECELNCDRYTCLLVPPRSGGPSVGECIPTPDGEYASLEECEENCFTQVFSCNEDEQTCDFEILPASVIDDVNYFGTFNDCIQQCSRFTCTHVARGDHQVDCLPDPCGEYATYDDCINSCGIRTYGCTVDLARGLTGDCIPDPFGGFQTLGDCQDECPSVRYTCTSDLSRGILGGCEVSTNGEFFNLDECLACCDSRYTCDTPARAANPPTSICVPNPAGEYESFEQCQIGCGERYTCLSSSAGDRSGEASVTCEIDSNGEFSSLRVCREECVPMRYNCLYDDVRGVGIGCVEDPEGPFTSPGECEDVCGPHRYACRSRIRAGFAPVGCVPDECGEYGSFVDCVDSCGLRTYTCNEPTRDDALGCVVAEGDTGEFVTLEDCSYECPAHSRYTCQIAEGRGTTCVPDENGEFNDLAACERCCGTAFSCDPNRVAGSPCFPDHEFGEYSTIEECESSCGIIRYTCAGADGTGRSIGCVPSASGEYASLEDCLATCGQNFRCTGADRSAMACVVDSNGFYSTLGPCLFDCPLTRYECDSQSEACYPTNDLTGSFDSLEDCQNSCAHEYSCVFDTNGGHCEFDVSGPYTFNDCEANVCDLTRQENADPQPVNLPSSVKVKQKKSKVSEPRP